MSQKKDKLFSRLGLSHLALLAIGLTPHLLCHAETLDLIPIILGHKPSDEAVHKHTNHSLNSPNPCNFCDMPPPQKKHRKALLVEKTSPKSGIISPPQQLCRELITFTHFSEESTLLCNESEPSALFVHVMKTPYTGEETLKPILVLNQSKKSLSKFAAIGAMRINQPIDKLFELRAKLNTFTINVSNATITSKPIGIINPLGAKHQGGFELAVKTQIHVFLAKINLYMIQQREFYDLSGDGRVRADLARLKPNSTPNSDYSLSNVVGFWMAESDNTTLVVTLLHQEVKNRGFPNQALSTFTALVPALAQNMYTTLNR